MRIFSGYSLFSGWWRWLCFASLYAVLCHGLFAQPNAGVGHAFIVEVEVPPADNVFAIQETIKALEFRLNRLGGSSSIKKVNGFPNRLEVRIFGAHDGTQLRELFVNRHLELREVVSPGSPQPYRSFATIADAAVALGGGEEVKSYQGPHEKAEHFVILRLGAIVSGDQVKEASAFSQLANSNYQVSFTLSTSGANAIGAWTERNISKYIAVVLDGEIISISYVKSRISDQGEISGAFSKVEAELIASSFQSGMLPHRIRILSEQNIKPR